MELLERLAVREALARLPRTERRVAELLGEGFSTGEVAQRLQLQRRTVERLRRRLARRLAAFGPAGPPPPGEPNMPVKADCLKSIGDRNPCLPAELEKS